MKWKTGSKGIKKSGQKATYERRGRWYKARNIGRRKDGKKMDKRNEADSKEMKKSGKKATYERRGRWYKA
jgi:hypothetical protein